MNKILSTWSKRYFSHPEALVLLFIIILSIVVFKTMASILTPILISVVFSYLLFKAVRRLEKWHFPHLLAVILVYILFISLFLLAFLWLFPLLWQQTVSLVAEIPMILNRGQDLILRLNEVFPEFISVDQMQRVMAEITAYLVNLGKGVVTFSIASLLGAVTLVVYLVLVPLLVFFFLRDGENITKWLLGFLPENRKVLKSVWNKLGDKIRNYVQGKAIETIIIAIVTIIAFKLLGLRYAILLGALVGLSVVIPYVGVVLVTVPVIVVGIIQWGFTDYFFYLMLVYTAIVILDANVLVPILFSEVMNLHPLAIILAVLVFGSLFGFWGVFFAIPLVALVQILIELWPRESC